MKPDLSDGRRDGDVCADIQALDIMCEYVAGEAKRLGCDEAFDLMREARKMLRSRRMMH